MHLSNSSYAKVRGKQKGYRERQQSLTIFIDNIVGQNLDHARMKACVDFFSPFFVPGGWMALGGEK